MKTHLVFAVCCSVAAAQSTVVRAEEPFKFENVTWDRVEFLKFKPGKRIRAGEILQYNFTPARLDAGLPPAQGLHLATGEWDMIYVYPMSGGPTDMIWEVSPEDVAFEAALRKRFGAAKAGELLTEWQTLIERQERQIAHVHRNW